MRIGQIVLKIRLAETEFGDYVAGSAELGLAMQQGLQREMAFVIPLVESATTNDADSGLKQTLTERFAVIVALKNDNSQSEKLGLTAYDRLHNIRAEIWKAILDWHINAGTRQEAVIMYRGGRLLEIDRAYMWYQFEFEYNIMLQNYYNLDPDDSDGVDVDLSTMDDFNTIYANYVMTPSANIPYTGDLPNESIADMSQSVDLTQNPNWGGFARGFQSGFDFYNE
jgi:hypothetical protein